MRIIVDAMGGDNAPEAIVNGCMDAINEKDGFEIILIGDAERIGSILKERNFSSDRIVLHHTSETISGEDSPVKSIKKKQDSSMVTGFNLLKEKQGSVLVSAGNSGALMAGALMILGGIKGVDRPALGAIVPTKTGKTLIIDAGLNTVCKPVNYLQFGIMGSIYMKELFDLESPKVGLVNIGSEQAKGNELIKQAYNLLADSGLNFIGNIEGSDIPMGKVDVVVCDGFTGNVMLKFLEGVAHFIKYSLKEMFNESLKTKVGALLIKNNLKSLLRKMDGDEHGGAPILGTEGIVVKSHGNSKALTIKNVIIKAYNLSQTAFQKKITDAFMNISTGEIGNE